MSLPERQRIRHAFDRAAASYDSAAEVQRTACRQLLAGLPEMPVARWLDAGAGTGFALPLLGQRYPAAEGFALDLAEGMLQRIATPVHRLAGDAEQLPLADASLDLYWSSFTLQWCDLGRAFHEARRVLRPGGWLAISTLGSNTFHELRQAFAGADAYRHTLDFVSPADVGQAARTAGLMPHLQQRSRLCANYADFGSLLRAVKAVGANQLGTGRRSGLAGRAIFHQAETAYEGLRTAAGLPLTYDVITLYAQACPTPTS